MVTPSIHHIHIYIFCVCVFVCVCVGKKGKDILKGEKVMSEETINDYLAQYSAHPEVKNVFRKECRSPCINIYRSI